MIEIKTLSLFQGNSQNNDQITDFYNWVLCNRYNNFYALVTPSLRDQRQRKQKNPTETDTTAIIF